MIVFVNPNEFILCMKCALYLKVDLTYEFGNSKNFFALKHTSCADADCNAETQAVNIQMVD